jgi:hypothetical protein
MGYDEHDGWSGVGLSKLNDDSHDRVMEDNVRNKL